MDHWTCCGINYSVEVKDKSVFYVRLILLISPFVPSIGDIVPYLEPVFVLFYSKCGA